MFCGPGAVLEEGRVSSLGFRTAGSTSQGEGGSGQPGLAVTGSPRLPGQLETCRCQGRPRFGWCRFPRVLLRDRTLSPPISEGWSSARRISLELEDVSQPRVSGWRSRDLKIFSLNVSVGVQSSSRRGGDSFPPLAAGQGEDAPGGALGSLAGSEDGGCSRCRGGAEPGGLRSRLGTVPDSRGIVLLRPRGGPGGTGLLGGQHRLCARLGHLRRGSAGGPWRSRDVVAGG